MIATGSNKRIWQALEEIGHTVTPPVPSLFTFHIHSELLNGLAGISLQDVSVRLSNHKISQSGPLLITHEGLSGPAVLKLSAWGARELHALDYRFDIAVNWFGGIKAEQVLQQLRTAQAEHPKKYVSKNPLNGVPRRFWSRLCELSGIDENRNYAELGKKQMNKLVELTTNSSLKVTGKSTNKEEFVTAGGVELGEIDMSTFKSKKHNNLFLAGEVLNVDAVTGGFNFQAAWTGGYLIGNSIEVD